MRSIRVETSAATILLTEAPETKIKDRQTGEIATDTVSGEPLMTLGVVHIKDGESSLLKVTVPQSGVSEGLTLGGPVALPGLVAARGRAPSTGSSGTASPSTPPPSPRPRSRSRRGPETDAGPDDVG